MSDLLRKLDEDLPGGYHIARFCSKVGNRLTEHLNMAVGKRLAKAPEGSPFADAGCQPGDIWVGVEG